MLNVNDWHLWLNSSETITAIRLLEETVAELKEAIVNGSHIQEKDVGKISLDYTYSLGQVEGLRVAISMIEDISSIVDEEQE